MKLIFLTAKSAHMLNIKNHLETISLPTLLIATFSENLKFAVENLRRQVGRYNGKHWSHGYRISCSRPGVWFVCATKGKSDHSERVKLPYCPLLQVIDLLLENRFPHRSDRGGRYFLDKTGIQFMDTSNSEFRVCKWDKRSGDILIAAIERGLCSIEQKYE